MFEAIEEVLDGIHVWRVHRREQHIGLMLSEQGEQHGAEVEAGIVVDDQGFLSSKLLSHRELTVRSLRMNSKNRIASHPSKQ